MDENDTAFFGKVDELIINQKIIDACDTERVITGMVKIQNAIDRLKKIEDNRKLSSDSVFNARILLAQVEVTLAIKEFASTAVIKRLL